MRIRGYKKRVYLRKREDFWKLNAEVGWKQKLKLKVPQEGITKKKRNGQPKKDEKN